MNYGSQPMQHLSNCISVECFKVVFKDLFWEKQSLFIMTFIISNFLQNSSEKHNTRLSSCWLSQLTSQESSESDLPFRLLVKMFLWDFFCSFYSFFKITFPMFFFNFFNHKLSPFRRWSMNVVNCFEIFCTQFCVFGGSKRLQILFLGCLNKS